MSIAAQQKTKITPENAKWHKELERGNKNNDFQNNVSYTYNINNIHYFGIIIVTFLVN